jgi:hypothetical protein
MTIRDVPPGEFSVVSAQNPKVESTPLNFCQKYLTSKNRHVKLESKRLNLSVAPQPKIQRNNKETTQWLVQ